NYGHNHPAMKRAVIEYIATNGITHSLDKFTVAKRRFLETFRDVVLKPRGMSYKLQFPGPTGTNAVEAALKLARKVTGRQLVISFTNAFHGMTLGSLAVTGNGFKRGGAGVTLTDAVSMPFNGYLGDDGDSLAILRAYLTDRGSGMDLPAAVIVETVQAEGGINVASREWLEGLQAICREFDILLIIDDVQAGCGRTGPFFSFEGMDVSPDLICLSKSLGGMGLPMALTLIKPEHDVWEPGEHNGTFRGNNLAFVAAAEALDTFWRDDAFENEVKAKAALMNRRLNEIRREFSSLFVEVRGRGLIQGIECRDPAMASPICAEAFSSRMLMETSGINGEVIKCLPPLVITEDEIEEGMKILRQSISRSLPKAAA
ncbi:MAG: diaminobutyrate--2-oxoglutarate transaminase, partial [Alphaproteobacteria bacterium]|nr:diaminobutyrate--2-oxoglutarate transaminase [Alphaproteobacteria bacterium]